MHSLLLIWKPNLTRHSVSLLNLAILIGVECARLGSSGKVLRGLSWGLTVVFAIHGTHRIKTRIPQLINMYLSCDRDDLCHLVKNNKQLNKVLSLVKGFFCSRNYIIKWPPKNFQVNYLYLLILFCKKLKEKMRKYLG